MLRAAINESILEVIKSEHALRRSHHSGFKRAESFWSVERTNCLRVEVQQFNARLVTACILEPGDSRGLAEAKLELSSWLGQADTTHCELEVVARKGRAAERIVSLAAETKADLIVLGAQHPSPSQTWPWGDTTEFVLRRAPVPVLVVPP